MQDGSTSQNKPARPIDRLAIICALAGVVMLGAYGSPALAQANDTTGGDQPSLDELLELGQDSEPADDQPARPREDGPDAPSTSQDDAGQKPEPTQETSPEDKSFEDLRQRLQQEAKDDPFASAVEQMQTVAQRLGQKRDAGRNTQRLQQDILKKLDQVLAKARQQRGGGRQNQKQQQQGRQNQGGQKPGGQRQSQQQASQGAKASAQQPTGQSGEAGSTAATDAEAMKALRRQWGNLPPRLRSELSEGLDDPFSPIYRSMTEEYYQRLAEQVQSGE
jgi:hypothetical protein